MNNNFVKVNINEDEYYPFLFVYADKSDGVSIPIKLFEKYQKIREELKNVFSELRKYDREEL